MSEVRGSVETESKFQLTKHDFERLRREGRVVQKKEQLNVYYDSAGKLVECAITLRVRFTRGQTPEMTLKIPEEKNDERRQALEMEVAYPKRIPVRQLSRDRDLPESFRSCLADLGVKDLDRLGWMRTTRWVIGLADDVQIELDRVSLPGGRVFFEAEVETPEVERHARSIFALKQKAPAATPSGVSKFERFVECVALGGAPSRSSASSTA